MTTNGLIVRESSRTLNEELSDGCFSTKVAFSLFCSLVLMCVIIGLTGPSPVRVDVGIQPVLPVGSSIKPEDETPIQMAAEVVKINVRQATKAITRW